MKRVICIHILLAFLLTSAHTIVDHKVSGHHAFSFLHHTPLAHAQDGKLSLQTHHAHSHDPLVDLLGVPHMGAHTHFVLSTSPQVNFRLVSQLLWLQWSVLDAEAILARSLPVNRRDFQSLSRLGPLYLRCCTFLI